jgi:hypothetical protein
MISSSQGLYLHTDTAKGGRARTQTHTYMGGFLSLDIEELNAVQKDYL